jgi:hypothetical protein
MEKEIDEEIKKVYKKRKERVLCMPQFVYFTV